jgi:hypothetical protein
MKTRTIMAALLVTASFFSPAIAIAAPQSQPSSKLHYVYFTLYSNLISRLSPRPDLLEVQVDPDLKQIPLREALRRLFTQAKQEYVLELNVALERRITLQGKGMLLSEALDQLVHQAGGGWMQEIRNQKPVIRVSGDLRFMTGHLPATPELLKEIAPLLRDPAAPEPTDQEIRQMTLGGVVRSGRAHNLLGRHGIPSVTIP